MLNGPILRPASPAKRPVGSARIPSKMAAHRRREHETVAGRVYCFVADKTGYSLGRIRSETTLLGDIGFDGDDAAEFFEHFARQFQVDMRGFELLRYFHSELECVNGLGCLVLPVALLKTWFRPDNSDIHERCGKVPIRVRDLVEAAETKKWPNLRAQRDGV